MPAREYGLLRAHQIFAPLPVATAERLARGLRELRPGAGSFVISQGEPGDAFYVVAEGTLDAFVDGNPVRTMGAGDGFGEIALLRDVPRTASVRAGDGVVLLALERDDFLTAITGLDRSGRSATAISDERMDAAAPASTPDHRTQLRGEVGGYEALPADEVLDALLATLAATRGDDVLAHAEAGDGLVATYADPARAADRALALLDSIERLRDRWPPLAVRLVVDADPARDASGVPAGAVYATSAIADRLARGALCCEPLDGDLHRLSRPG